MNISVTDVEIGVYAPGQAGTPTPLALTGLTSSASQSFTNSAGTTTVSSTTKNHHHE